MKIHREQIDLESKTQIQFMDITDQVQEIIDRSGIREGQVLIYVPHTTMGVAINHNESMLLQDFMRVLYKIVPVDDQYTHDLFELKRDSMSDGRSNGHSHCKAILLGNSETIPVEKGKMRLTERQNIFAVEFDGSRKRDVLIQVIGI
ncbi:MAG: secondary thiamine-phosphate synthase enzyme YjbQ [Candidatus Moranbacteria bacterium]|jgi:secondary thiamine-phosphate synthase enzyme|nr:secondary thiamine-phosphate synthase enzyme YjbQ [Candidatus Moranbacteria bacterium]MBP9801688.1 secondary thiamine-phosphate synthase enzyme YjbQ [Candidatus Moranbacteria bacterium]